MEKFHHKSRMEYRQPSSELGSLPDTNVYYEGWVHYYHYANDTTIARPRLFFQNNEYYAQRVPISTIKNRDRHGVHHIPTKSSFFLVLTPTSIQMFSSRDDTIRRQTDSLTIDYINAIPEDKYLKGGVRSLGSFSIGHCFEIKANIPNGQYPSEDGAKQKTTWVFCLDNDKDRQKLQKLIIKLKLKLQRRNGKLLTEDTMKMEKHTKTLADLMAKAKNKIVERDSNSVGSPRDGYWLLLQNWTDCTLKCGGGESYQQWQCVPPKNGGKDCQGKAIRIKKCNVQPCPGVGSVLNMLKYTAPEVKKPIVKVAPFSSRLQRYSKCVIKENDAFLSNYDEKTKVDSKMPVRVVMNNRTLTVYKDDEYQDVFYSYVLKNTQFVTLSSKFCCFQLRDGQQSNTLCGYDKNCGDPTGNQWVNGWANDFTLFKVACNVGRAETLLSPDDEAQLAEELRKKLGQAQMDINGSKQKKMRQSMMLSQNSNLKKLVSKTQNLGFNAIEKELQLENLIKNEEKAKEDSELATLMKKIQAEKDKQACLHNTIKERDLDADMFNERRSTENEIKEIKQEVAQQVQLKRAKMKKMLEMMRAKARLRKAALQAELNGLRQKMAEEMMKASKVGDQNNCKKGITDFDYRESYCNTNYVDDFIRNSDCKTTENYCYMCCENEFGNMHIDKRNSCYNMCDMNEPKKTQTAPAANGPWVWTPKK